MPVTSHKNRATRSNPEHGEPSPHMSIPETAKYLRVNENTVRVMIADGRLKAYRLGERVIRLRRSEIDAAMEEIGGAALA
jgi:excisionase family DNA binding protein